MGPASRYGKNAVYTAKSSAGAGVELPAVDVDHVGQHAEHEERDADRQDDVQQRERRAEPEHAEHVVEVHGEEVEVLEHAERDQVGGDGEDDPAAGGGRAAAPPARPVYLHAERLVDQRRRDEQEDEPPVPEPVEHVAGGDDEPLPQPQPRHEQPVEHVDHEKEDRERDRREEHAAACQSPGCARPSARPRLPADATPAAGGRRRIPRRPPSGRRRGRRARLGRATAAHRPPPSRGTTRP